MTFFDVLPPRQQLQQLSTQGDYIGINFCYSEYSVLYLYKGTYYEATFDMANEKLLAVNEASKGQLEQYLATLPVSRLVGLEPHKPSQNH